MWSSRTTLLLFIHVYISGHKQANIHTWTIAHLLKWRHNDHDGVSNHQPHGCLLNRLFTRRSKKTSKLRVTGLCVGNSPAPVNSPHNGPVMRFFLVDDFIMLLKTEIYNWEEFQLLLQAYFFYYFLLNDTSETLNANLIKWRHPHPMVIYCVFFQSMSKWIGLMSYWVIHSIYSAIFNI